MFLSEPDSPSFVENATTTGLLFRRCAFAAIVTEESLIPCASFAIVFPVQGAIKSASIGRAGPKGSAETMSVTGGALHNSESLDKCSAAVPKRLSVSAAVSLIIGTSSYSSASPSSAGKSFPYVQ